MHKTVITLKNKKQKSPVSEFYVEYPDLYKRKNQRFDFEDEWNNLGYGRIDIEPSPYSISDWTLRPEDFDEVLATVKDSNENELCVFMGIKNSDKKSELFINREVGVRDGVEVALVEDFLTNYKIDRYGSEPILSEIPFGYDSAVTMRIDCDEDIASGNKLADLYFKYDFPFSMAIKTNLDFNTENVNSMLNVIEKGGSIVSHSHTHDNDWGGRRVSAKWEVDTSRSELKKVLPENYPMEYVVSPFHQNSREAIKGLVDAGVKGFVGGIIKNDPDYLQSRAGYIVTGEDIITHSQQCMLHGDCFRESGLKIYKKSFDLHYKTRTFFGFLDHPFSDYWYGWDSEEQRLSAHEEFINYIKSYKSVWYANLIDAMNFLWVKSNTKVWIENNELKWSVPEHSYTIPSLCVLWNGEKIEITSN